MTARLSPRLLPEAVAEALFPTSELTPCARGALAHAATHDPRVLQAMVDTLLLHVHEPTELETVVAELAAEPHVRRAFEEALAAHRGARMAKPNPAVRLPAADPRLPCSPLGELEGVTFREPGAPRPTSHTFTGPRPVLAHNPSGLVILGGSYRLGPRGLTG